MSTSLTMHEAPALRRGNWLMAAFGGWGGVVGAVICLGLLALVAPGALRWLIFDAVPVGTAETCRAASGACWAFVANKTDFILFGFYPAAERWRAWIAIAVLAAAIGLTATPAMWRPWRIAAVWIIAAPLFLWLMGGGLGLTPVPNSAWGGLPLSLMFSLMSILAAFPLGVALALGRRSEMPLIRWLCAVLVELPRGVPFLSILFMASIMLPLFLPVWMTPDKLGRAMIAFVWIAACYHCEAVRGALQSLPPGQIDAARALGLGWWKTQRLIILPQACRVALPALTNNALTFLKETSLVSVIGLYDLLGTVQAAGRDPDWLGYTIEGFVFAAALYMTGCALLSAYAGWLERRLSRA